jgi:hypothetical protein
LLLCLLFYDQHTCGASESKIGEPAPPDLTDCTRVEIHYLPSLVEAFFPGRWQVDILSPTELAHVQSLNPIVVEEGARVKAVAQKISSGTYLPEGRPARLPSAKVTGYRRNGQVISFTILEGSYVVAERGVFKYKDLALAEIATDMGPLILRHVCAAHIMGLARRWYSYPGQAIVRPAPDTWCDAAVDKYLQPLEVQRSSWMPKGEQFLEWALKFVDMEREHLLLIRRTLRCPAGKGGECHYAMNSNCTAKSPPDMVFLFEAKAGWNQHGGPELFTFDHHNPKGGLVCLNDFTVKFIRTQEEVKQLRWK